jgi:DNA-binding response OmpR family regulator
MKETALHVLLVEDNAGDAPLAARDVQHREAGQFRIDAPLAHERSDDSSGERGVDVVLLDPGLPDAHGLDTVRQAHAVAPGVPLIVLTGLDDEALAGEAMKEGAQDYLIKGG